MTWVKKDDGAPLNKKFFRAGLTAYGWWDAALCYCNRYLTDGFVPARDIHLVFPGTPEDVVQASIAALVEEGSLHPVESGHRMTCPSRSKECPATIAREKGWSVHDFFAFQPSRKDVMKKRRENTRRGRKGAEMRWNTNSGTPSRKHSGLLTVQDAPSRPVPSRPEKQNPTRARVSDSGKGKAGKAAAQPELCTAHGQPFETCPQCAADAAKFQASRAVPQAIAGASDVRSSTPRSLAELVTGLRETEGKASHQQAAATEPTAGPGDGQAGGGGGRGSSGPGEMRGRTDPN